MAKERQARSESGFDEPVSSHCVRSGFTQVPNAFLDSSLAADLKQTLILIASYAHNGSTPFPSRQRLSSALGVSKKTVSRWVKKLEEMGYLSTVRGSGRRSTRYERLTFAPSTVDGLVHADRTTVSPQGVKAKYLSVDVDADQKIQEKNINLKDDNDIDGLLLLLNEIGIERSRARRALSSHPDAVSVARAWLDSGELAAKYNPAAYLVAAIKSGYAPASGGRDRKRTDAQYGSPGNTPSQAAILHEQIGRLRQRISDEVPSEEWESDLQSLPESVIAEERESVAKYREWRAAMERRYPSGTELPG